MALCASHELCGAKLPPVLLLTFVCMTRCAADVRVGHSRLLWGRQPVRRTVRLAYGTRRPISLPPHLTVCSNHVRECLTDDAAPTPHSAWPRPSRPTSLPPVPLRFLSQSLTACPTKRRSSELLAAASPGHPTPRPLRPPLRPRRLEPRHPLSHLPQCRPPRPLTAPVVALS